MGYTFLDTLVLLTLHAYRNHLKHYDERLKRWIAQARVDTSIVNHHVAAKQDFPVQDALLVTFYDPITKIFTFVDEDLSQESQELKKRLNLHWLKEKPLQAIE